MYLSKSMKHPNFSPVIFSISLLLGVFFGSTLPLPLVQSIFPLISNILFQFILYFTIPYLFFSLLISTYELHNFKKFWKILRYIITTGGIITGVVVIVSLLIFLFLLVPNQNNIPLIPENKIIPQFSIAHIIENIFSLGIPKTRYATQVLLAPLFILAIILGLNAKGIGTKHPLLEVCNALRTINLIILETLFPWFSIPIFILAIRNISTLRYSSAATTTQFYPLLLFLLGLLLLLTFVIYPLIIKRYKISMSYKTWCRQIIPAMIVAFVGGNMTSASIALLYVDDLNNSKHKITDTTITLSFIFARAGTATTIALSYIMISKIYTAIPLSFIQILLIFVASCICAMFSNAIATPIIITSIASLSQQFSILFMQNLYLSILPFLILLHSLSAAIDIVTCGFVKLYVVHTYQKKDNQQLSFIPSTSEEIPMRKPAGK